MRTERELAHVLGHERELELSSHFGSRDELNEERVQILASDSERELAHIFHELLMLCIHVFITFCTTRVKKQGKSYLSLDA